MAEFWFGISVQVHAHTRAAARLQRRWAGVYVIGWDWDAETGLEYVARDDANGVTVFAPTADAMDKALVFDQEIRRGTA